MDDDKNLDALQAQLVPSPEIDLSDPTEEADVTELIVEAMDN